MSGEAADLSAQLAARMDLLAAELLPAGKRNGGDWRCGSLAGEAGSSLSVRLVGARAGVWFDFHTGEAGDALDLVAAVLYRGDKRAAMMWARRWLGLPETGPLPPRQSRPAPARAADEARLEAEVLAKQRSARRMFFTAQPELRGTPAAFYLAARGIDLAELGRQPRSLRFIPALEHRESGRAWPAMVAAMVDSNGLHISTHQTFLAMDAAGRWTKAPVKPPKKMLGSSKGGAIRLWRGASGKPLAQAHVGETVAIAEGIETALSIVLAAPHLRVLCAGSLSNMAAVNLPTAIRSVLLCADNDGDNAASMGLLQRAVDRLAGEGRAVRIARPPAGIKDFNDLLQAAGA